MIAYAVELCGWRFWLGLFLGIIIVLWLIYGLGKKEEKKHNQRHTGETDFSETTVYQTEVDYTPDIPTKLNIVPVKETNINPKEEVKRRYEYEEECRKIFEGIYNEKFPKARPNWLINPESNRCLELDGYCEKLKLAFEYNGSQHYIYPNWTNQSYEEFIKQIRRDTFKVDECDRHGVYLVTIPYNIPKKKLREYIDYYRKENMLARQKQEK